MYRMVHMKELRICVWINLSEKEQGNSNLKKNKRLYVIIVLQLDSAMDSIYLVIMMQIENANLNKTVSAHRIHFVTFTQTLPFLSPVFSAVMLESGSLLYLWSLPKPWQDLKCSHLQKLLSPTKKMLVNVSRKGKKTKFF